MSFLTFQNKVVSEDEISHQHLSNWYYWCHIVMRKWYNSRDRRYVRYLLDKRFDGVILSYHPHPKFAFEKNELTKKGYLMPNGDIIYNGKKIGNYENVGG